MSGNPQVESEAPAKVWQVEALAKQITNLENLIVNQHTTYPTRTELELLLEKRDNKIAENTRTLRGYSKALWVIGIALIGLIVNLVQTFLQNLGRTL